MIEITIGVLFGLLVIAFIAIKSLDTKNKQQDRELDEQGRLFRELYKDFHELNLITRTYSEESKRVTKCCDSKKDKTRRLCS